MTKIKKQNPEDENDLRNYTQVKLNYFTEVWQDHGNDDGKLKMIDLPSNKKPLYYIRTEFLTKE